METTSPPPGNPTTRRLLLNGSASTTWLTTVLPRRQVPRRQVSGNSNTAVFYLDIFLGSNAFWGGKGENHRFDLPIKLSYQDIISLGSMFILLPFFCFAFWLSFFVLEAARRSIFWNRGPCIYPSYLSQPTNLPSSAFPVSSSCQGFRADTDANAHAPAPTSKT